MQTNKDKQVTYKLLGLPTPSELKALYIKYEFDRNAIAKHLGITTTKLNRLKKDLLGNCELPSTSSYRRQFNEVQWFTTKYAEWTHVPKRPCKGNSTDMEVDNDGS